MPIQKHLQELQQSGELAASETPQNTAVLSAAPQT